MQKEFSRIEDETNYYIVPVLLDSRNDFQVYCEISWQRLGCVLMQEGKVEEIFPTNNLEIVTIIHALKI